MRFAGAWRRKNKDNADAEGAKVRGEEKRELTTELTEDAERKDRENESFEARAICVMEGKTRTLQKKRGCVTQMPKCAEAEGDALFDAVVGGFAGDDDVVDVGFAEAGARDADEAAVGLEIVERGSSDVAHAGF